MAEDVDSQLKRMAEDLKEIIEQINTTNSNQDQDQSTVSGWVWFWSCDCTVRPERSEWVGRVAAQSTVSGWVGFWSCDCTADQSTVGGCGYGHVTATSDQSGRGY